MPLVAGLMVHDAMSGLLGPLRAFPFAQGYKVDSTLVGGRSIGAGEVRKVTNLNDSGAGSLRNALSTVGPADIVFEVAGAIPFTNPGPVVGTMGVDSNITVWGETAPSPGITITSAPGYSSVGNPIFATYGNNVIYRHLRFRLGSDITGSSIELVQPATSFTGSWRTMFANCSFAYNADEMVGIATAARDLNFYRCLFGPGSGTECKALLFTGLANNSSSQQIAVMQSFFVLNLNRCPEFHSNAAFVYYNNYIYACGNPQGQLGGCFAGAFSQGTGASTLAATHISFRGNQYEGNANDNRPYGPYYDQTMTDTSPQHEDYFDDNTNITRCVRSPTVVIARANETDLTMTLPEVATVRASSGLKSYILARAGARPLDQDTVDSTSVTNAQNGTGTLNFGAPPAYSLGTGSRALSVPSDWNQQAPGEATGWRVLDKWIYQNYTTAVETQ